MGCNLKYLSVIFTLTLWMTQSSGHYVCTSNEVNIPKLSAKVAPSAYTSGPGTQFRITKVYDNDIQQLANFTKIKDEFIEPGFQFWQKVLKPKVPTSGTLRVTRTCETDQIYWIKENGVDQRYCFMNCNQTTSCSSYIISNNYLDHCRHSNGTEHVNDNNGGRGVSDTDMLVFISYRDHECGENTLAHATTCQRNANTDRPEVAYINYCPTNVKFEESEKAILNSTTIHELGHALGFTSSSFAYMRDKDGNPRTPRTGKGNTPNLGFLGGIFRPSTDTLIEYNKKWISTAGSNWKRTFALKTENVLNAAKNYFKCLNIEGVDLENYDSISHPSGHLEMSLYKDEVMAAVIGKGYVSNLTLAFMKDTGWYTVEMSAAEALPWGQRKGCTFARNSCLAYMDHQTKRKIPLSPWCNQVERYCQNRRMCNLRQFTTDLPIHQQYIRNIQQVDVSKLGAYGGTDVYMDRCPYYQEC